MAFFECEFPRQISFGSIGGDTFSTIVKRGFSGFEQRNRNWEVSLAKFQIILQGKLEPTYFTYVHDFFMNVGGMADGFRFYWPLDHVMQNTILGTGDDSTTQFQLVKNYTTGARTYTRTILKPITSDVTDFQGNTLPDTVVVRDNATTLTPVTDYTVDYTNGVITMVTAPVTGHIISADCEFHIPVRFDIDTMGDVQLLESDVKGENALVSWPQIMLQEVRIVPFAIPPATPPLV